MHLYSIRTVRFLLFGDFFCFNFILGEFLLLGRVLSLVWARLLPSAINSRHDCLCVSNFRDKRISYDLYDYPRADISVENRKKKTAYNDSGGLCASGVVLLELEKWKELAPGAQHARMMRRISNCTQFKQVIYIKIKNKLLCSNHNSGIITGIMGGKSNTSSNEYGKVVEKMSMHHTLYSIARFSHACTAFLASHHTIRWDNHGQGNSIRSNNAQEQKGYPSTFYANWMGWRFFFACVRFFSPPLVPLCVCRLAFSCHIGVTLGGLHKPLAAVFGLYVPDCVLRCDYANEPR